MWFYCGVRKLNESMYFSHTGNQVETLHSAGLVWNSMCLASSMLDTLCQALIHAAQKLSRIANLAYVFDL